MVETTSSPGGGAERKHPRFALRFPVRLKVSGSGETHELDTMSRNVSLEGVFLEAPTAVAPDSTVEFIMTIRTRPQRAIRLKGSGRVVRVERDPSGAFGVAVQCTRPIHHILKQAYSTSN